MAITGDEKEHLEAVADDTLTAFGNIAKAALAKLAETSPQGADVFASINTLNSESAVQSLGRVTTENQLSWKSLSEEPAIARVVVRDDAGKETTYYICRATPVAGAQTLLASYRSSVGRLAALPIGSEFSLQRGGKPVAVEIVERAHLRPSVRNQDWDSLNSVLEGSDYGPVTVQSLRQMLRQTSGRTSELDLLDQILAQENESTNVLDGIRRNVIKKMALRDQPVLDQYQDAIFRCR